MSCSKMWILMIFISESYRDIMFYNIFSNRLHKPKIRVQNSDKISVNEC